MSAHRHDCTLELLDALRSVVRKPKGEFYYDEQLLFETFLDMVNI